MIEWLEKPDNEATYLHVADLIDGQIKPMMMTLTSEQRRKIISMLTDEWCWRCGKEQLCYCGPVYDI